MHIYFHVYIIFYVMYAQLCTILFSLSTYFILNLQRRPTECLDFSESCSVPLHKYTLTYLAINLLINIYFVLDHLLLQIMLQQVSLCTCRNVCMCHRHIHHYTYLVHIQQELNSMNKEKINHNSQSWEPISTGYKG